MSSRGRDFFEGLDKKILKNTLSLRTQNIKLEKTSMFICGSVTVEASLVLSFFILFCATFMSLFNILGAQIKNSFELDCNAQKLAAVANMDEDYEDDIILNKTYYERLSFLPEWTEGILISQEVCRRPWTGRIITDEDESNDDETYVYVTENASVYHTTTSCTHLNLKVQMINASDIDEYRNENGARYKRCEKCGGGGDTVYITPEGDKYHSSKDCSGLKRTYKKVKLSEIDLPPCSRCGG